MQYFIRNEYYKKQKQRSFKLSANNLKQPINEEESSSSKYYKHIKKNLQHPLKEQASLQILRAKILLLRHWKGCRSIRTTNATATQNRLSQILENAPIIWI